MNLEIKWSPPFKLKSGGTLKWRREWLIPIDIRGPFFNWWKKNKFKLILDGFSVYKKDNDWFLTETQIAISQFKNFEKKSNSEIIPQQPEDNFVLTPTPIKNKEGLRSWQIESVELLVSAINKWNGAINGSEMGTGKTYVAIGAVRDLNANFVIVCPKAVISQWKNVVEKHFGLKDKCIGIINYELLIRGKTESDIASYVKRRSTNREEFVWKLPKNSIIIWDEAHKLKNWKTQNSKTCMTAFKQGYRQIFLSASIATTPLELRTIGTCLKMFKSSKEYYQFLTDNGCYKGRWGMEFNNSKTVLKKIHSNLFDKRGVRLRRDSILDFPECEIEIEPYNMDEESTKRINQIYEEMHQELKKIEKKSDNDAENELTIRLRSREKSEMIKIPLIQEMVEEAIESGMSVVVFLNFSASIDALAERLNTRCIFDGRIGDKAREQNKKNFQLNTERVILINSSAGGVGLSIGDETGEYPRIALISPDDSAFKMKQVQGRIWRENSKSKSIQRFIFVSGTIEEIVANNVKQKLDNLELLNDGDLKL